jgi:branched-chain amino acid transport system permease protein
MMQGIQIVAQYAIFGVVEASIIALPAVVLTLVYGILGYPNFAIGDLVTLGAYLVYTANSPIGSSLTASFVIGALVYAGILVGIDQGIFRPVRKRGAFAPILLSIGLILVVQNTVRFFWGNGIRQFNFPVTSPLLLGGLRINGYQILTVGTVTALVIALHVLLRYTRIGKAVRASASNPNLAMVCGIDPERVAILIWVAAGVLLTLAGGFLGLNASLSPLMGWGILLPVYAAAVLGGVGNVYGAIIGAGIIGVTEELSVLVIPDSYKSAMAFFVLALVLLLRPTGLIGRATRI